MTSISPTTSYEPVAEETVDASLRRRAARVIPGGMWGHMNAARLPASYPQYFARARGCRLWDVDGNEYIDLMCSYGPMILGYGDEDVERAAARQREQADIANGPSPRLVELAELVVGTIPHADWVMFAKNGADATTTCVTLARAGTRRRKVLVARGSYHGAVPWCTPSLAGVTAEDRAHLIHFDYNDVASLEAAVDEAGDDLAAILVTAFRHDVRRDQELATPAFARAARALCGRKGAALIIDDVRAGFRLHLGGSWEPLGVRPDLAAWSKAIANGHPLAAVTGNDRFRPAAQEIFVTGSFWCAAVPMAAAIATLHKLHAADAVGHMTRIGERLRGGIEAQARRHGVGVRQTGPVQMPMILFDDDAELEKGNLFAATALRHGVYLHPWHNMFLSLAHGEAEIDRALEATDQALAAVARRFG
jgi:glutamate-1-semialdehyde 2,1-aminomutase